MRAAPLLRVRGLCKAFGGVAAVDEVDLELAPGEILGLVGENGAGKSTVVKMLSGTLSPDAGEISVDGEAVKLHGARAARAAGISVIHQELALIDTFSVAENVFLGEPYPRRRGGAIDWAQMRDEARAAFAVLGHDEVDVTPPGLPGPRLGAVVHGGRARPARTQPRAGAGRADRGDGAGRRREAVRGGPRARRRRHRRDHRLAPDRRAALDLRPRPGDARRALGRDRGGLRARRVGADRADHRRREARRQGARQQSVGARRARARWCSRWAA